MTATGDTESEGLSILHLTNVVDPDSPFKMHVNHLLILVLIFLIKTEEILYVFIEHGYAQYLIQAKISAYIIISA